MSDRLDRLDRLYHWIARHLPRRLVYWCAIVVAVHATTGEYSHFNTPSMLFADALKRWYDPHTVMLYGGKATMKQTTLEPHQEPKEGTQ